MKRVLARCGFACATAVVVAAAGATSAWSSANTRAVPASWVRTQLRAGHRVVLRGVRITGALNLDGVDTVRRLFECHDCTFVGPVSAHDVIFDRTVDLSGTTFSRGVDFTGATFHAPALFRASVAQVEASGVEPSCRFRRVAVFSLAIFDDLASFGGARFCATAEFLDTRFADATFSNAGFLRAEFDRAAFRGAALFNDAHFARHASFEEADFRVRADFARAHFNDGADFADTRFASGASFLVTRFSVAHPATVDESATFQDAVAGGDLDFTFAEFHRQLALFSGLVSSGSLVFRDAEFDDEAGVSMDRLQARDLVLDVNAVKGISDPEQQLAVLGMIEDSAKARNDLKTANDAQYQIRVLRSHTYSAFWAFNDYVFYRGAAGYFVRPLRPVLVLIALVTVVALVRTRSKLRETPKPEARAGSWESVRSTGSRGSTTFLTCLLDTFAVAGPRWRGRDGAVGLPQRFEVVIYRLLLVCALIGLANSNPTLRQMVDSLF